MRLGIIFALLLTGCAEKESANLEGQLKILEDANKSTAVLCAKASEVADAYLKEENAEGYKKASLHAATYCAEEAIKQSRLVP